MIILIDDREYKSRVTDWFRKKENVEVIQQRLPAGDYIINDQLIFERKTLPDFAASIKDGRLFPQMQRLADTGKKSALLLEGTSKDLQNSLMRREAIQGALIQLIYGNSGFKSHGCTGKRPADVLCCQTS